MSSHAEEEFLDLNREPVYDSQGRRIDEDYVAAAVADVESDEVALDEDQAIYPRRGRPSLSQPRARSPRVDTRVPTGLKAQLEQLAHRQHRSESDVVREALEEYLARH